MSRCLILTALVWLQASLGAPAGALELKPCHLDHISEWARCGSLAVPEDPAAPAGRSIELRVAVLPAFRTPKEPDPIFVLAGGPGQSAVKSAAVFKRILGEANQGRDIVLVDQRGTGGSSPLECDLDFDALAFDPDAKAVAVRACLEGLEADPRQYTTVNHVRDLEAVRAALGYGPINLYGGSYGTRVALIYLREFPEALRAVVMDGVAPMDMRVGLEMGADAQLALDGVFARCAADADCAERFPNLAAAFARLLQDLEANPRSIDFPNPATGEPEHLSVDHRYLALGLRALLYSPSTQRLLPLLIDQAAAGNLSPFIGLASASSEGILEVVNPSLMLAVLCAEDLAGLDAEDIPEREKSSFVGRAQVDEFLGYCAAWPEPLKPMEWAAPSHSGVPVLLLSGSLDPATPAYRADSAAAAVRNVRHLEVAAGAHIVGVLGCMPDLIAEFYVDPDPAALDGACSEEIHYPSFFTSLLGPRP